MARPSSETGGDPAFKFDHVHIISEDPHGSARWYVEMLGATIAADTVARGAPQIFVSLGGMTILIRGRRPGEEPQPARPIRPYGDFSSHNAWGTDHFGFMYQGDLAACGKRACSFRWSSRRALAAACCATSPRPMGSASN